MKSIKIFAVAGAIGLLGLAGLSSCKQNNSPEGPDGNYKGETVKTEFVISFADDVMGSDKVLRMPGNIVQIDQNRTSFRGMDSICLIPFDGNFESRIGKNIALSPIPASAGTGSGKMTEKNTIFYSDVAIPVGTKRFLFYGKAVDESDHDLETIEKKFQYGIVKPVGLYDASNNPDVIKFDLVPICSATNITSLTDSAQALADYAKLIANTVYDNGTPLDGTDDELWSSASNAAILDLYTNFTSMKAGSSNAILAAVEDLYNTLSRFQATQVTPDDLVKEILKNIKTQVNVSATAPAPFDSTLTWKSTFVPKNYPTVFGLPEGVAYMAWNGTESKFEVNTVSTIGTNETVPSDAYNFGGLEKLVYPASLQYFAQSKIKTSAKSQQEYYNNTNSWDDILGHYENNDAQVRSNTKSVAIKDSIDYGVGNLKIVLKRKAVALEDNYGTTFGYDVSDPKLTWKGVLIGGQKQVNYDFTCNTSATEEFTIYDNYINGALAPREGVELRNDETPVTNYTLVFSTKNNTSNNDKVYIVLEFTNTLGDFIGLDNKLISKGGTFYLVGELNSASATTTIPGTAPLNHNIFYKDFITTANINLGADCLKNAYYTIPDLRSTGLELGFAVSLTWQTGLEFNIDL